jgi:plastocyanin
MAVRARQAAGGAVLVTLFALLSACGSDDGGTTAPVANNEVSVGNNVFTPASRTVAVGTTVTWRWAAGAVMHNVTFPAGTSSPNQSSGTFERLFSAAGTFAYTCTIHGASMSGSITVQ